MRNERSYNSGSWADTRGGAIQTPISCRAKVRTEVRTRSQCILSLSAQFIYKDTASQLTAMVTAVRTNRPARDTFDSVVDHFAAARLDRGYPMPQVLPQVVALAARATHATRPPSPCVALLRTHSLSLPTGYSQYSCCPTRTPRCRSHTAPSQARRPPSCVPWRIATAS